MSVHYRYFLQRRFRISNLISKCTNTERLRSEKMNWMSGIGWNPAKPWLTDLALFSSSISVIWSFISANTITAPGISWNAVCLRCRKHLHHLSSAAHNQWRSPIHPPIVPNKSTNGKEANLPVGAGGLREGSETSVAIKPKFICIRGSPFYVILPKNGHHPARIQFPVFHLLRMC